MLALNVAFPDLTKSGVKNARKRAQLCQCAAPQHCSLQDGKAALTYRAEGVFSPLLPNFILFCYIFAIIPSGAIIFV